MGVAGPGANAAERTDVDDAAMSGAEVRQSFAGDEKRAAGVGLEDRVPLIEGEAFEGRGVEDGGVVDEQSRRPKAETTCGDGGADGGFGAHVAGDGEGAAAEGCDFGGGCGSFGLGCAVGDGDVGASASQSEGDGAADAAGASGDESGLAGEGFGKRHRTSLARWRGLAGAGNSGFPAFGAGRLGRGQGSKAARERESRSASSTELGIALGRVDALQCRFPQENGTLHNLKCPT